MNPEFPDTDEIGTAEDRILVSSIDENTITLNVEEELWGVLLENKKNIWSSINYFTSRSKTEMNCSRCKLLVLKIICSKMLERGVYGV